ncbi:hypothetical protein KAFR_0A04240 [Kazachstania africana CBS 2517]|uniref:Rhodanese domain-containing protein n=1 Tax=Kazachstania africana (strain ATCC 22294 / BCRC 22015 / CBS 2517 / CECT 1963 / NBRC 1671 / NRRL Y-8276) TaxID=1071382 RepID=H2ANA9_KAZAF|nr:hypothetical protein KAFR_0A04240 [Kazachstania africana CBS 2517]CCF55859.1 hypothetical protein KAFR_0A04240 [Kazachstania africana CBS 2517]
MGVWQTILDAWNGVEITPKEKAPQAPVKNYNFQDMKELVAKHDPNVVLVDVREPSEYSVVNIPGSINVPYRSHPDAFALDTEAFEKTFGVQKPNAEKELVFFCASGMRGAKAQNVAANNGYKNSAVYPGSMNDWVGQGGDKLKL